MMSIQERDRTEAKINVSLIERDLLIEHIEDLRRQRAQCSPLESDYLAEVIHFLSSRLTRLEVNIAQNSRLLDTDRSERQSGNVYRIH